MRFLKDFWHDHSDFVIGILAIAFFFVLLIGSVKYCSSQIEEEKRCVDGNLFSRRINSESRIWTSDNIKCFEDKK